MTYYVELNVPFHFRTSFTGTPTAEGSHGEHGSGSGPIPRVINIIRPLSRYGSRFICSILHKQVNNKPRQENYTVVERCQTNVGFPGHHRSRQIRLIRVPPSSSDVSSTVLVALLRAKVRFMKEGARKESFTIINAELSLGIGGTPASVHLTCGAIARIDRCS